MSKEKEENSLLRTTIKFTTELISLTGYACLGFFAPGPVAFIAAQNGFSKYLEVKGAWKCTDPGIIFCHGYYVNENLSPTEEVITKGLGIFSIGAYLYLGITVGFKALLAIAPVGLDTLYSSLVSKLNENCACTSTKHHDAAYIGCDSFYGCQSVHWMEWSTLECPCGEAIGKLFTIKTAEEWHSMP